MEAKEKASVIAPNKPHRRSQSVHVYIFVCVCLRSRSTAERVTDIGAKVRTDSRRGHDAAAAAATGRVAFHIPLPVTQQRAPHCPFGGSAEVATAEEPEYDIYFVLYRFFFFFYWRPAVIGDLRRI